MKWRAIETMGEVELSRVKNETVGKLNKYQPAGGASSPSFFFYATSTRHYELLGAPLIK